MAARLPAPPLGGGKTILVSSHLLQEVEQTVDDVVIIANGRLVRQGPLETLQAEATTVVRTTDLPRLGEALAIRGVASQLADGGLLVSSADLTLIGDTAFAAGLAVHELRASTGSLEALYFQLTEGTNRNQGNAAAGSTPTLTKEMS